jgi:predicted RNA binding protein YcfA (HicA-like mRNA interferase family)
LSRWIPCKRRDFVKKLRRIGFEGIYSGTRHQFMVYGQHRLTIPSNDEYSVPQLRMMIGEVEVILEREMTLDEWNSL